MIKYKVKIDEKTKSKEIIQTQPSRWLRFKKYLTYPIIIALLILVFIAGMYFQMYRELNPATRNDDIAAKDGLSLIAKAQRRDYIYGTLIENNRTSIIVKTEEGKEVAIIIPTNIIILGGYDKPSQIRDLEVGLKLDVTVEKQDNDTLKAVRIKLD